MREIEFWKFFFLERGKVRQTARGEFDELIPEMVTEIKKIRYQK